MNINQIIQHFLQHEIEINQIKELLSVFISQSEYYRKNITLFNEKNQTYQNNQKNKNNQTEISSKTEMIYKTERMIDDLYDLDYRNKQIIRTMKSLKTHFQIMIEYLSDWINNCENDTNQFSQLMNLFEKERNENMIEITIGNSQLTNSFSPFLQNNNLTLTNQKNNINLTNNLNNNNNLTINNCNNNSNNNNNLNNTNVDINNTFNNNINSNENINYQKEKERKEIQIQSNQLNQKENNNQNNNQNQIQQQPKQNYQQEKQIQFQIPQIIQINKELQETPEIEQNKERIITNNNNNNINNYNINYSTEINSNINEKEQISNDNENETQGEIDDDILNQLEIWTGLKCSEILFDSDDDNWGINNSVFNNQIIGEQQLIFLIESENDEKFGYYIDSSITSQVNQIIETDMKSFHFNVLSQNNRLIKPLKFELKPNQCGKYCLYHQANSLLISLGDLTLFKENSKDKSYYIQNNDKFNYYGIEHALCGKGGLKNTFIPKRIVVIQMQ